MDPLLAAQIRLAANTIAIPTAALWVMVGISWVVAWFRDENRPTLKQTVRKTTFWVRLVFVLMAPAVGYAAAVTREYYAGIVGGWYTPADAGRLRVASILVDVAMPMASIMILLLLSGMQRAWDIIVAQKAVIAALRESLEITEAASEK